MRTTTPYYPHVSAWPGYLPPDPLESDPSILDDVKDELFWSSFVDADEVSVRVDDGVVTLTGKVDTHRERPAAAENAYEGGAILLENELDVAAY